MHNSIPESYLPLFHSAQDNSVQKAARDEVLIENSTQKNPYERKFNN